VGQEARKSIFCLVLQSDGIYRDNKRLTQLVHITLGRWRATPGIRYARHLY
jgi:hypothetical protein